MKRASEMTELTIGDTRQAHCPSCGSFGEFTYAGEQRWREEVAKAAGLPSVVKLWHCTTCHTTLVGPDLEQ